MPTDLVTTSATPRLSNTARIGPPAMMPVPPGRRTDVDLAGTETALAVMVQRAAFLQRHADHLLLGSSSRLGDGFRHFARLAMTEADAALAVADHDQRGKAEALAALHGLGDAVDVNELLDQLSPPSSPSRPRARRRRHGLTRSPPRSLPHGRGHGPGTPLARHRLGSCFAPQLRFDQTVSSAIIRTPVRLHARHRPAP